MLILCHSVGENKGNSWFLFSTSQEAGRQSHMPKGYWTVLAKLQEITNNQIILPFQTHTHK